MNRDNNIINLDDKFVDSSAILNFQMNVGLISSISSNRFEVDPVLLIRPVEGSVPYVLDDRPRTPVKSYCPDNKYRASRSK
jgi:hypothetical protein